MDPPGSLVKCCRLKATTGVRGVSVSICASTHSLFKHIVDRSDLGRHSCAAIYSGGTQRIIAALTTICIGNK